VLDPKYAPDAYNLSLLIARLWIGGIFLAHGYRHLKAIRSGPGMANWFESLGLRNGKLQAMNVTYLELAAGAALVVGLLTPFSYGGAAWVGLTSTRSADRPLLVPFAGPWIALHAHVAAACGQLGGPCGQETAYSGLLIADGLVQAASAVQIALAFVHRELHETSEPVMRTAHVGVAPARAPGGGLALAAVGEF